MTRRTFLMTPAAAAAAPVPRSRMGVATTSFMNTPGPRDTVEILEYAHGLGAGGIQAALTSLDAPYTRKLRERASKLGMYVEVMARLPNTDLALFERTAAAAKNAGARCIRTACLGGRRYETFKDLAEWQRFVADSLASIDRALPVAEKHRIPLAVENHKDWTADELASIMKSKSSAHLGVCLDTGNNIALLDDPMEVVEMLAPYAISTHIKDMGVEAYADGFLLSEVPLGEGILDLKRVVAAVRKERKEAAFTLEMITRDPLRVPCMTETYWATFAERSGSVLARAFRLVRDRGAGGMLPRVSHLPEPARRRLEEDNVRLCLNYARTQLGL